MFAETDTILDGADPFRKGTCDRSAAKTPPFS
jgi:hypothetical protein